MTLSTGTKLSHYEISSQLGKGGMGEVYQAEDQKLGREVAIKVLPEEFAKDAERVARFQREAKLLASLNHPNIAGMKESSGNLGFVEEILTIIPPEFSLLQGAGSLLYPSFMMGVMGAILALSNIAPGETAAGGEGASAPTDDDVIDAEYVDVDAEEDN